VGPGGMGAGTKAFEGNQPSKNGRVTKREHLTRGGRISIFSAALFGGYADTQV